MVTDLFGTLLQELGQSMGNVELTPDKNNSCLVRLKSGLKIQLELDRAGSFLILGSDLGEIPPGKYRENIFREALKANDLPHPLKGTLAFSKKSEHLIIFEKIATKDLNGSKILSYVLPFVEKAQIWSEALKRGELPVSNQTVSGSGLGGGMFGLRP